MSKPFDASGVLWACIHHQHPHPIPTSHLSEVRQVALHRLHDLQIVPSGSRLTRLGHPVPLLIPLFVTTLLLAIIPCLLTFFLAARDAAEYGCLGY